MAEIAEKVAALRAAYDAVAACDIDALTRDELLAFGDDLQVLDLDAPPRPHEADTEPLDIWDLDTAPPPEADTEPPTDLHTDIDQPAPTADTVAFDPTESDLVGYGAEPPPVDAPPEQDTHGYAETRPTPPPEKLDTDTDTDTDTTPGGFVRFNGTGLLSRSRTTRIRTANQLSRHLGRCLTPKPHSASKIRPSGGPAPPA